LVWAKGRTSGSLWNVWFDSIRGGGQLSSNQTDAELSVGSNVAGYVSSYDADGFTVTAGNSSIASLNLTGQTYVAWNWRGSDSAAVTNTAGSITSTVSANPTAGFSIVTYTGTGVAATVGHGLGVAPKVVLIKVRSDVNSWLFYTTVIDGSLDALFLNLTNAAVNASEPVPTSTVFTQGGGELAGANGKTYVAYCFSEVAGYSRFGSYTGNGSADGPFVFCGFRPAFVMVKQTNTTGNWFIRDTKRDSINASSRSLYPNLSDAEFTSGESIDILSNGFKLRSSGTGANASSGTYIFMALAENPFKNTLAR